MRMCLICRPKLTYMSEHFFFFLWTDRTVQTLAPLYNINLKMAGLCWSDNPNCCYKYNMLCQPCSSLWLHIILLFKFRWLNLLQDPTFNQTGSLFKALQFVFYLKLTTFNWHRMKFRFLSSVLYTCFVYLSTFIWILSGMWNALIPKYCL